MSGKLGITIAASLITIAGANIAYLENRAEHWRPDFEEIGEKAEFGPVEDIDVQFGGCGWRLGETITVETSDSEGDPWTIEMCRNRDGTGILKFTWSESKPFTSNPIKAEKDKASD